MPRYNNDGRSSKFIHTSGGGGGGGGGGGRGSGFQGGGGKKYNGKLSILSDFLKHLSIDR